MTDQTPFTAPKDTPADETFGWTADAGETSEEARKSTTETVQSILGSLRDAFDDLAERATPTVREVGARTAEITALAAHKAAPMVRKAGDVASDASEKLAVKSRDWAAEVRASIPGDSAEAATGAASSATESAKDVASDAAAAASDVASDVSQTVADATEAKAG